LRDIDPALRIVLLTDHKDEDSLERSLGIDADGYITNQSGASEVLACLDALREGKKFTSAVITTYLFKRESARRAIAAGEVLGLTKSERLVLRMVAEHRTNREIGDALCISHRTVENHRTIICSKLGLRGPHALVKFALTHKKNL
ncbi:MAG: response regulator transcription factor, partial [Acidobacteria bacterium]|nr:response regulator transcription factor [Acidobacteriota bacterium]